VNRRRDAACAVVRGWVVGGWRECKGNRRRGRWGSQALSRLCQLAAQAALLDRGLGGRHAECTLLQTVAIVGRGCKKMVRVLQVLAMEESRSRRGCRSRVGLDQP
jgi:hypothetical protein